MNGTVVGTGIQLRRKQMYELDYDVGKSPTSWEGEPVGSGKRECLRTGCGVEARTLSPPLSGLSWGSHKPSSSPGRSLRELDQVTCSVRWCVRVQFLKDTHDNLQMIPQ